MKPVDLNVPPSRRTFLKAATALAVGYSATSGARALTFSSGRPTFAYVGTDTRPVDGAANGKGIYLFETHQEGALSPLKLAAETTSPSWLSLHPSGRYLYAVNEVSDYNGDSGSVSAFAIDRPTGDLRPLNVVSSLGAGPTHMSIDASGKFAFVANYFGGSIAVLSILPDGSLGPAVFTHQDQGSLGSLNATDAPPGSFAISGHDTPHAHMIQADPENRFVLQTDLGQDRIYVFKFDSNTGRLMPANTPFVSLPSGDGPRHFAFHPNGRWMYSIQEEASTLVFWGYDATVGSLTAQQTVSTLPLGFTGTNFCSEVMMSPDGRFLYAANRLHNSIAVFLIERNGKLHRVGETLTEGDYPNQIKLGPSGNILYVCNQRSDQITSFRVDRRTGM
ncbi:MAG: lactonase family protein, partial [Silvibacterium sp.]